MKLYTARFGSIGALVGILFASASAAQTRQDLFTPVEQTIAAAEASLRDGELQIAESHYRSALMNGWILLGALRLSEQRMADAHDAFTRASTSAVDAESALRYLAVVDLQIGDAATAVTILTRLASAKPKDVQIHRVLAQALMASGQPDEAIQELEEASTIAPDDLEITFALAAGQLQRKNVDAADRLFAEILKAKPLPQTFVLIGRAYRDAGQYDRARAALQRALKIAPRTRRAHYYLGTIHMMAGVPKWDEAIAEFREELKIARNDPATTLRLGMALVEQQRHHEALAVLTTASRAPSAPADAFYYLGRCQLALDRFADAAQSFERALELAKGSTRGNEGRLQSIHYQLGVALRRTGAAKEADAHFAEAQRSSDRQVTSDRERLGRYLADTPDPSETTAIAPILDLSPFASLSSDQRDGLEQRTSTAIARAYVNLGVMQAQKQRFARAADFFEKAVAADPDFPRAQQSLGIAYFNSHQYEKAATPLARALAEQPDDLDLRRMLAMAYLNTDAYAQAAELLRGDPRRATDAPLEYAYALALIRSDRPSEAEAIFSRLLAEHKATPELTALLGQAHAQQGDYDAAIASFEEALKLKPDVADANAALGLIYLKLGRLTEAENALRAELAAHAENVRARHTLAAVLDAQARPDEALEALRAVLKVRPGFADARYLYGKILLAQGGAQQAVEHLEIAKRLAPDEANIRYQLGLTYQKLGRADEAQAEFDAFRQLKDKRRGSAR